MEHTKKLDQFGRRFWNALILPAVLVLVIFLVLLVDEVLGLGLARFGILPRDPVGLRGILFAPLLHGDLDHAVGNSTALLMLGWALMYFYPRSAGRVFLFTWLVSGVWVWISARDSHHIGASGVVYGLAAFLFMSGVFRRQRTLMALSLLVVFLYGSMVWGVFPIVPRISWEGHLWGAVGGTLLAWYYRKLPAAIQDPVPVLDEDDEDEEPLMEHMVQAGGDGNAPIRIVYHFQSDAPSGASDAAGERSDPDRTSGTWSAGDPR
ncbi:MAG: rhomboid family intramembrane serine protease [Flavobacteriales bacterium]|nr:rhomboid family intramembrane serine protease [Flavobacteriales bacterium]